MVVASVTTCAVVRINPCMCTQIVLISTFGNSAGITAYLSSADVGIISQAYSSTTYLAVLPIDYACHNLLACQGCVGTHSVIPWHRLLSAVNGFYPLG